MKMVRLIFVGIMLAFVCVGFTSCGHEVEDMDPITTETVENGTIEIDVRGEDPEEDEDDGSGGNGDNGDGNINPSL